MTKEIVLNVRWLDGYLERFECNEVRASEGLLFIRLTIGQNRHIPLSNVRWYSLLPESHDRDRR